MIRPTFYHWGTDAHFTVGSFRNVRKLQTRRTGPRLTGMSISHYDGSVDILGQWDYSRDSSISEIYDESDGNFTSITFIYCGSMRQSYVTGIFINTNSRSYKAPTDFKPPRTISFDTKINVSSLFILPRPD